MCLKHQLGKPTALSLAVLAAYAIAIVLAHPARAAVMSSPTTGRAAGSATMPTATLPERIMPPHLPPLTRGTGHSSSSATRSLASVLPTVICGVDRMDIGALTDGRATGGEWMYWWPEIKTGTYFYAPDVIYDQGPLFANRAGT